MAAVTLTWDHIKMIKAGRYPATGTVAVVTDACGRKMASMFALSQAAVMAAFALTRDNIRMVEPGCVPHAGAVTLLALIGGDSVRRWFTGDLNAVVTGNATTDYC